MPTIGPIGPTAVIQDLGDQRRIVRLHILSDLHLERMRGRAKYRPHHGSWPDYDILVLAGDIGTDRMARQLIDERMRNHGGPIVYVLGHHEFYTRRKTTDNPSWQDKKRSMTDVRRYWRNLAACTPNLTVLDEDSEAVNILGIRFVGATLWPASVRDLDHRRQISVDAVVSYKGRSYDWFRPLTPADVTDLCHRHVAHVWRQLDEARDAGVPCVVVTHYPPPYELLEHPAARLWIYGDHGSVDCDVGRSKRTRLVCNARGHHLGGGIFENPEFDPRKVVRVWGDTTIMDTRLVKMMKELGGSKESPPPAAVPVDWCRGWNCH